MNRRRPHASRAIAVHQHVSRKRLRLSPWLGLVFAGLFGLFGAYTIWHSLASTSPDGDLNHDGVVNIADLSILLSHFGTSDSIADINGDGTVNVLDISILLSHYNQHTPVIALTSPQSGATVSSSVTVSATVSDQNTINKVTFAANGAAIGTDTISPYTVSWDTSNLAAGTYRLTATAYDAAGNQTTSDAVNVTISAAVNLPLGVLDPTQPPMPNPIPTIEAAKWTVEQSHVPYATIGGTNYILDIYAKNPAPIGNTPAVLYFHGCGCNAQTNDPDVALKLGQSPPVALEYLFRSLINNGYRVIALGYPIEYPNVQPSTGIAAKAAVRFIRANAAKYHVDPTRLIAWGESGGGIPVCILGTTAKNNLDQGNYLNVSSRVEAAIDWYGVTDTCSYAGITPDDAPFMIQHGTADYTVPPSTSKTLLNTLLAAHVFAELQWVYGTGHKFGGTTQDPPLEDVAKTAVRFVNALVRDNPNPLPQ